MPDPSQLFSYFFSVGLDIMAAQLDTTSNAIRVQAGDSIKQQAFSSSAEWWQHSGFASIPSPPVAGSHGCQGIALKRSDRDIFFASRDVRAAEIYGSLKYGETVLYGTGADGNGVPRFLIKQDGSLTRYAQTGNTKAGDSIADAIGPTGWSVGTPWGAIALDENGLHIAMSGGGGLQIDTDGNVSLLGLTSVVVNGASVSLGAGATALSGVVLDDKLALVLAPLGAAFTALATALASPPEVTVWAAAAALVIPALEAIGAIFTSAAVPGTVASTSVTAGS
jgi:hypothetical protein